MPIEYRRNMGYMGTQNDFKNKTEKKNTIISFEQDQKQK